MPRYSLVTFGCQMNQHDSARIAEVLGHAGYERAERPELADVVLLNTCSVREKAEQKLRSEVGRLGMLKRERPELVISVMGCVAQQEGERLLKRMPQVDLVIGPDNIAELPDLLREVELGGPPRARTVFDVDEPRFLAAKPVLTGEPSELPVTAYVTIMKGCDERCSFCIVPYTRGPERYRPSAEIVNEISELVASGTREVTLLGQTVNSYRDPSRALAVAPGTGLPFKRGRDVQASADESEFAALLRAIGERVPALRRLRYTSPHPRHLTMSLIRAHQDLPVLARHVHMPVQSGSDRVLRRMIRRYSVAEYVERIQALRDAVPELTLSTDVIVGFPGESSEDFQQTLELVERIGFVGLFGFKYSERPYTPARKLGDDVAEAEKSARLARLFELSDGLKQRHLASLVGSVQEVLVEASGEPDRWSGRTKRNDIVHVSANGSARGELIAVRIRRAFKNSLEGEPIEDSWAPRTESARTESATSGDTSSATSAAKFQRSLRVLG